MTRRSNDRQQARAACRAVATGMLPVHVQFLKLLQPEREKTRASNDTAKFDPAFREGGGNEGAQQSGMPMPFRRPARLQPKWDICISCRQAPECVFDKIFD